MVHKVSWLAVFPFVLMILLAARPAGGQESAKSLLQSAKKQENAAVGKKGDQRRDELRKALDLYRLVPKSWPDAKSEIAISLLRSAELEQRLGDLEGAMKSLDQLIAMNVDAGVRGQGMAEKASVLRKRKDFRQANETLDLLIAECGDEERLCAQAWLTKASMARQERRWDAATHSSQQVLDSYPTLWRENVDAADLVCSVLIRRHEWAKAIEKLGELDRLLKERFQQHEKWGSISKAIENMSARRILKTVDDTEEESGESSTKEN